VDIRGEWHRSSIHRFSEARPRAALFLGASLVAAFSTAWLLLQKPDFFLGYDFVRMHVFYKEYFREALLGGHLPLWNPFIGLGRPFQADIETAVFYPPNWLVLFMGVYWGVAVSVFLHQALAIYCGVRLGRVLGTDAGASWLLGAGLALGSPFAGRLAAGVIEGYFTLCWWPALLWLGVRLQDGWSPRLAAGFATAAALAILAGQPPLLFVEFLGVLVFLAFRQDWPSGRANRRAALGRACGLAAAGLLGACLAGVQLLPFLELVGQGNRPLQSTAFATADGMRSLSWLSLIIPASSTFSDNWEQNLHCGIPMLFAALGAAWLWRDRNVRALLGLGLLGALFAAGDATPLLGWALRVVPGAAALRLPSRYGVWLAVALLGLGSVSLSSRPSRPFATLALGLAACAAGLAWLGRFVSADPRSLFQFFAGHAAAVLAAAVLVGLWHGRARWPRRAGAIRCLLAAFCAGNWLWAISLQAPVYSVASAPPDEVAVRDAMAERGLFTASHVPPRISFDPADVRENAGMALGFGSYNAYCAPALERVWSYLHAATKLSLSGVDYIQIRREVYDAAPGFGSMNLAATLSHPQQVLVFYAHPDPRAYLSFDMEVVPDWRAAEAKMADGHDFHRVALAEAGSAPGYAPNPGLHASAAAITRFEAGRVDVRVRADAPAVLVLSEAWYPGWRASVAGRPAVVFAVNGWMRGVLVPAGESEVAFAYHSRFLGWGAALSLAAAVLVALLARRRSPAPIGA
jgi:hypothetical protein